MKQQWIEKQKIKSSWRAQKRKEGLGNVSDKQQPAHGGSSDDGNEDNDDADVDASGDAERLSASMNISSPQHQEEIKEVVVSSHDQADKSCPESTKNRYHSRKERPDSRYQNKNPRNGSPSTRKQANQTQTEDSSVRELYQKAYSRSSLHSFKSDPLHRRRGVQVSKPTARPETVGRERKQSGKPNSGKRGAVEMGQSSNTRGGQPNMKLRMEAMLAKIKRDYV